MMSNRTMKWEYDVIQSDEVLIASQLNAWGAARWEIFWINKVETDAHTYYEALAKRPTPANSGDTDARELWSDTNSVEEHIHNPIIYNLHEDILVLQERIAALQGSTANNGNIITPRTLQLLKDAYNDLGWIPLKEELERLSALQESTENRQKARLLLDLHERLDDQDDNVTAEELQTVLKMAAEELEK